MIDFHIPQIKARFPHPRTWFIRNADICYGKHHLTFTCMFPMKYVGTLRHAFKGTKLSALFGDLSGRAFSKPASSLVSLEVGVNLTFLKYDPERTSGNHL